MKLEYQFSPKQEQKLYAWKSQLPQKFTGAIGGRFSFTLTPTDIGDAVKVKDHLTGQELDLTECSAGR